MAEQEVELMSDIYNRLTEACFAKCISTGYAESDLTKGESVCIDRCVSKFFQVNQKLTEYMQQKGQEIQQQASSSGGGGGTRSLLGL